MTDPTTKAGRELHRMLFGLWDDATDGPKRMHEGTIADIEAEAYARALDDVRAMVKKLRCRCGHCVIDAIEAFR